MSIKYSMWVGFGDAIVHGMVAKACIGAWIGLRTHGKHYVFQCLVVVDVYRQQHLWCPEFEMY